MSSVLSLTSTTALESVNRMLASIGESPVNSLNTNGLGDVAAAKAALQEAAREIQDRGWGFNTDERVSLIPDVNGFIYVPANVLRIKPETDMGIRVVHRGNRLYDKDNNTFVFTRIDLVFRIVYILDFEDLPDVIRRYIAIKASRIFQQQYVSSQILESYEAKDEYEALALAQDYDTDTQDFNMIYGNPTSFGVLSRDDILWI